MSLILRSLALLLVLLAAWPQGATAPANSTLSVNLSKPLATPNGNL